MLHPCIGSPAGRGWTHAVIAAQHDRRCGCCCRCLRAAAHAHSALAPACLSKPRPHSLPPPTTNAKQDRRRSNGCSARGLCSAHATRVQEKGVSLMIQCTLRHMQPRPAAGRRSSHSLFKARARRAGGRPPRACATRARNSRPSLRMRGWQCSSRAARRASLLVGAATAAAAAAAAAGLPAVLAARQVEPRAALCRPEWRPPLPLLLARLPAAAAAGCCAACRRRASCSALAAAASSSSVVVVVVFAIQMSRDDQSRQRVIYWVRPQQAPNVGALDAQPPAQV